MILSNSGTMKYTGSFSAFLLIGSLLAPGFSLAATSATSSPNWFQNDGSNDENAIRERVQGWRYTSQFQDKIDALPATSTASILMPVLFGVGIKDISPNFGDPRDGGTRTHQGEDIMAVKGTPIVSPTPAVVLRIVTGVDEGNAIYTANPAGETFIYMHLDHFGEGIAAGTVLQQGSLIGYVGNTGNAAGGPAHLHFEIHDKSGTPVDPFPRLTAELPVQEKISDLSGILSQTSDSAALSQLLVSNFRATFVDALGANIALPLPIINALAFVPPSASPTVGSTSPLPAGDLDVGSSGSAVAVLQQYLIRTESGTAAANLAKAGATGNFGPITKAALIEYQLSVGISPASGYYGSATRTFIEAHPIGNSVSIGGSAANLLRDLTQGVTGEDVRSLQKLLNAKGYLVAASGSGSVGNETTYFGPATKAAVIKFQIDRGIQPALGYVGPLTRVALAVP